MDSATQTAILEFVAMYLEGRMTAEESMNQIAVLCGDEAVGLVKNGN